MKVAVKTRNEGAMVRLWLEYHSRLFGEENLMVIDHSSDCVETLAVYDSFPGVKIEIIPRDIFIDEVHQTWKYPKIYDWLSQDRWFARLDTDEFFCYYHQEKLQGYGLEDFLQDSYANVELPIACPLISNFAEPDPIDIDTFSLVNAQHLKKIGKLIVSQNHIPKVFCHAIDLKKAFWDSGLYLLHLDSRFDEGKRQIAIGFCETQNIFPVNSTDEERKAALLKIPVHQRLHYHTNLLKYIDGEMEPLLFNDLDYIEYFRTNVLRNVLCDEPLTYEFSSEKESGLNELFSKV